MSKEDYLKGLNAKTIKEANEALLEAVDAAATIKSGDIGRPEYINDQLKEFAREFDQDNFTPFPSVDYTLDAIMATAEHLDMMGHIRYMEILKEKIEKELESCFRREG